MKLFDSHAHYDDSRFEGAPDLYLSRAKEQGVQKVVNIGSNLGSSEQSIALAHRYEGYVYAAVGIHPSDAAHEMQHSDWLARVDALCADKKVVAIGEIGLDYHYGTDDKRAQRECFCAQMSLAEQHRLPVVIHDRDAHGDCLDIIRSFPCVYGVVHSYSGSYEMASELVGLGYYLSVNGIVTFPNAKRIRQLLPRLVREHPGASDRILVETDCPYLAPVPYRGKLNYSGYLAETVKACAALLSVEPEKFAESTYRNACRFYGIPLES